MKLSSFLIFAFVIWSLKTFAQDNSAIESLIVNYKLSTVPTEDTTSSGSLNAFPEAIVKLLTIDNVSKVHYKIVNFSNNDIVYSVNYLINSEDVLDNNGRILFSRNNLTLYLNSSGIIPLKTYSYELVTEDSQGNLSTIFSEIH